MAVQARAHVARRRSQLLVVLAASLLALAGAPAAIAEPSRVTMQGGLLIDDDLAFWGGIQTDSTFDPFVARLDEDNTTAWIRRIRSGDADRDIRVLAPVDGHLLAGGVTRGGGVQRPWFAYVDPDTGELVDLCGTGTGIVPLPNGFVPERSVHSQGRVTMLGTDAGRFAIARFRSDVCQPPAEYSTYAVGDPAKPDILRGVRLSPGGSRLYLLGSETAPGGGGPDAVALAVDAATLAQVGTPLVHDFAGNQDAFYAGAFNGTVLTLVGGGSQRVTALCVNADLVRASGDCLMQHRFVDSGFTFAQAGLALPDGRLIGAGWHSPTTPGTPDTLGVVGILGDGSRDTAGFAAPEGRFTSGAAFGAPAWTINGAAASASEVLLVGDLGFLGTGGMFISRFSHAGTEIDTTKFQLPPLSEIPVVPSAGPGAQTPPPVAGGPTNGPAPVQTPAAAVADVTCRCRKLKAFLNGFSVPGLTSRRLSFKLNWRLTCTAGKGNCRGAVRMAAPKGFPKFIKPGRGRTKRVGCKGRCGKSAKGSRAFTVFSSEDFTPRERANKSIRIKIEKQCAPGARRKATTLVLAFDRLGLVDYRKSNLDGVGGPDGRQLR